MGTSRSSAPITAATASRPKLGVPIGSQSPCGTSVITFNFQCGAELNSILTNEYFDVKFIRLTFIRSATKLDHLDRCANGPEA